jgi:Lon protease-like protein
MSKMLPLFPLGAVLYPGMLLPLHIFEERYRQLVRDLLEQPEPRQFGVIAIRKGRETGIDGVHSLYEIGCTATLRRVDELEGGRFDLVTVGTRRFRRCPTCKARSSCSPRTRSIRRRRHPTCTRSRWPSAPTWAR